MGRLGKWDSRARTLVTCHQGPGPILEKGTQRLKQRAASTNCGFMDPSLHLPLFPPVCSGFLEHTSRYSWGPLSGASPSHFASPPLTIRWVGVAPPSLSICHFLLYAGKGPTMQQEGGKAENLRDFPSIRGNMLAAQSKGQEDPSVISTVGFRGCLLHRERWCMRRVSRPLPGASTTCRRPRTWRPARRHRDYRPGCRRGCQPGCRRVHRRARASPTPGAALPPTQGARYITRLSGWEVLQPPRASVPAPAPSWSGAT